MNTVDVSTEVAEPPDWLPDTQTIVSRVLDAINEESYEVSVLLCDDERIAEINHHYRGVDGPTDVLTFSQNEGDPIPGPENEGLRGDIVVSLDSVATSAAGLGIDVRTEFIRVLTHGVLHLAGYTHEGVTLADPGASDHAMLRLQEEITRALEKEQDK